MKQIMILALVAGVYLVNALFYPKTLDSTERSLESAHRKIEEIYDEKIGEENWQINIIKQEDINQDGLQEIVTFKYNCSDWRCSGIRIFQLRGEAVIEIGPDQPSPRGYFGSRASRELVDLNGDNKYEILSRYTRFPEFPCNQCRPEGYFIYEWRNGRYEDATLDFAWYYEEKIRDKKIEIQKNEKENMLDRMAFQGLNIVFWYTLIGQGDIGLTWYEATIVTEAMREKWTLGKNYIPPDEAMSTPSLENYLEYAKMIVNTDFSRHNRSL